MSSAAWRWISGHDRPRTGSNRLERGEQERVVEVQVAVGHACEHARIEPTEDRDRFGLHRPHRPRVPLGEGPVGGVDQEQDDDQPHGDLERDDHPGRRAGRRRRKREARPPDGHEADRRQRRTADDDLPWRQLEAGDERPGRGDARGGHADEIDRCQGTGRSRGVRHSPSAGQSRLRRRGSRDWRSRGQEMGGHDAGAPPHTRGELGRAPARPHRVPVPDDLPVGPVPGPTATRGRSDVYARRHPARICVELVRIALGDRGAEALDRMHQPLSGSPWRSRPQPASAWRHAASAPPDRSPRPAARRARRRRWPSRAPASPGPHSRAPAASRRRRRLRCRSAARQPRRAVGASLGDDTRPRAGVSECGCRSRRAGPAPSASGSRRRPQPGRRDRARAPSPARSA